MQGPEATGPAWQVIESYSLATESFVDSEIFVQIRSYQEKIEWLKDNNVTVVHFLWPCRAGGPPISDTS